MVEIQTRFELVETQILLSKSIFMFPLTSESFMWETMSLLLAETFSKKISVEQSLELSFTVFWVSMIQTWQGHTLE